MKSTFIQRFIIFFAAFLSFGACATAETHRSASPDCVAKGALEDAVSRSEDLMEIFIVATEDRMGVEGKYGLALAVSVCGETVWVQSYGYADLENAVPVTNKTKFRIGSVSKTFTATALGQLAEDGALDLDAEIQTYVPAYPRKEFPVTVRQLAGHLAGIRHYRDNEFYSAVPYATVTEGLAIFRDDPLLFQPGTNYLYSTYGWNLLSAVVEGASGEAFLSYMDKNVFGPAHMGDTIADLNSAIISNRASFYQVDREAKHIENAPYVDNSSKWAGGGFLSTPTDVLQFAHAMFGGTLVSSETLNLLITSQTTVDGQKTHYGIGWATDMAGRQLDRSDDMFPAEVVDKMKTVIGDSRLIGHTGGSVGGLTVFLAAPDLPGHVIVAAVSNNDGISPAFALPVAVQFIVAASAAR